MTLVERFIEFDRWPVSRKTAVAGAFAAALHGFGNVVIEIAGRRVPMIIDMHTLRWILWPWFGCLATASIVGAVVNHRGAEGRWTIWTLNVPYVVFLIAILYAFGPGSTPLVAWLTMIGLIETMMFGLRIGGVTIACGFVLLMGVLLGTVVEQVPYAPIFIARTLEAQRNGWYVGVVYFVLLLTFAACLFILGLLIAARRLQESRLERTTQLIRRYVPSQLADRIISGKHAEDAKTERVKLTIFFSDLVGFTEITEELEPEDLSRVLNEYFSQMTVIADRHGGTVDELSGDAILIFFGAPNATNDKDHALRAVRMAIEMQAATQALNQKWKAAGIAAVLRVRMGVSTGVVTIGNFGSPDRMKYAALGKNVNLAARLQSHCDPGKILLSHATWLLINDQMPCVEKAELHLKGIHKPVMTYELAAQP